MSDNGGIDFGDILFLIIIGILLGIMITAVLVSNHIITIL